MDGDSIKVFVRVRPPAYNLDHGKCLQVTSPTSLVTQSKNNPKQFTFDHVVDENSTQEDVFASVGKRIVDCCIEGYNGTIFAYGQTGSGKTYTMLGDTGDFINDFPQELKGIIPRSLEYLFQLIDLKYETHGENMEFLCKCSFLEIYHEHIYDLLDSNRTASLHLRESLQRGVFVDGITEARITSASHAMEFLKQGWNFRHIASTSMNRESSRSHAVFSICIESKDRTSEVTKVRQSMLNLVDLAGSERQRDTETSGLRLKEAGSINKSLSVFGNVIMSLAEINKGKTRHVPYRDSKLTFLLRDSIGGNARTYIIANVHPNASCFGETLSTLYFAQRAKMIKNRARVNEDTQGDVIALQHEIQRLKLILLKSKSEEFNDVSDQAGCFEDYRNKFFEAMEIWKQDNIEVEELHTKLSSLQSIVHKLEKALLSMRMIVKFRDSSINKLLKKAGADAGNLIDKDLLRDEITALNETICALPRAALQVHRIEELERNIKRLQTLPNSQAYVQFSTKRKQALIEEFKKLRSERNPSDHGVSDNTSSEIDNGSLKAKLRSVETELEELKKSRKEEQDELKNEISTLAIDLKAAKFEKSELEKLLKASEDGARAQLKHLNMVHDNTIRVITTPKKGTKRPLEGEENKLSPRKLLKQLDGDSFSIDSIDENADPRHFLGDVHDVDDDLSAVAYKLELESEREVRMKSEQRHQELEKESISLKQQLFSIQEKYESLQQKFTSLQNSSSAVEKNLGDDVADFNKKLAQLTEDHNLKCEEVRDLRLTLTSADRELAEKKTQLKETIESSQKETLHLRKLNSSLKEDSRLKSLDIEKLERELQTVAEDNERALTELDFTNEQLAEASAKLSKAEEAASLLELRLKQANEQLSESKKLLEGTQLEREDAFKELTNANEHLRCDVADALSRHKKTEEENKELKTKIENLEKTNKNNKLAMTSLLEQVNELRGALSLRDICSDGLRSELAEHKEKMNDMTQKLEDFSKREETYKQRLQEERRKFEQAESKLNFQIDNLQDDVASLSDHFTSVSNELEEKEKSFESERQQHEKQIAELRGSADEMKQAVDDYKAKLSQQQLDHQKVAVHGEELTRLRESMKEQSEQYDDLRTSYNEVMRQYQAGREMISQLEVKLEHSDEYTRQLQREHAEQTDKLMEEQALLESRHHLRLTEATKVLEERLNEAKTAEIIALSNNDAITAKLDEALEEIKRNDQVHQVLVADVKRLQNIDADRFVEIQQLKTRVELERAEHQLAKEKLEAASSERDVLAAEAAKLAGHSNHLQKIHYMEKIKKELAQAVEERNSFKARCLHLTEQLRKHEMESRPKQHSLRKSQSPRHSSR